MSIAVDCWFLGSDLVYIACYLIITGVIICTLLYLRLKDMCLKWIKVILLSG